MRKAFSAVVLTGLCSITFSACATSSGGAGSGSGSTATPVIPARVSQWNIKTREHVDLWLHGFAMLQADSSLIPFFRRGYRDDMVVLKNRANVMTQLDVNVDRLQARLTENASLINAQFIPLYFSSGDGMRAVIDRFIAVGGNPRAASSQEEANAFAMLAEYFPSQADRNWLALFASGLWDEQAKFYHSYWIQQQRERSNVIDSVQSLWQNNLRPKLRRYLNSTQQANGDILLSLPLDGEGRMVSAVGSMPTIVAVTFPTRPSDAQNTIYVLAHELIAPIAASSIRDNTTPAQQRSGEADQLSSAAAVRGGLLLLQALAPEFAQGYANYYLRAAGQTPNAKPTEQLAALFPLPEAILGTMTRQLATVQGGI